MTDKKKNDLEKKDSDEKNVEVYGQQIKDINYHI